MSCNGYYRIMTYIINICLKHKWWKAMWLLTLDVNLIGSEIKKEIWLLTCKWETLWKRKTKTVFQLGTGALLLTQGGLSRRMRSRPDSYCPVQFVFFFFVNLTQVKIIGEEKGILIWKRSPSDFPIGKSVEHFLH